MILDNQTLLSDAQAVSSDGASTNTYDRGGTVRDASVGEPLGIFFSVDVAADATTGDETYEFQVIQSANADLSSPDIIGKLGFGGSSELVETTLAAGYKFVLPIPAPLVSKRYLGAYYNVGGTSPSITVTASILPLSMIQAERVYADGFTITS